MVAARMLSLVLVAAVAAFHSAVAQTVSEDYLNSYQWMATYKTNGQTCVTTWQQIQATYYSGDNAACGDLVFKALITIVPSQCPGGAPPNGDRPGGELWNCMTGNGANTALKDAWVNFVRNCEIFYVAYRFPGEAESGFKSKDNSCLRKFVDTDAFRSYLNARPGNDNGSAETIVSRALPVMFAIICSVVLALLF